MKNNPKSNLAEKIYESEIVPGLKLFVMPTKAEKIVTIKASLLGGEYFSPSSNKVVAEVMAEMLDRGTHIRTKRAIHDLLDSRGITIEFSISRFQLNIFAHCLSEDLAITIEILAEMLKTPSFPDDELAIVTKKMIGDVKERETDTRARAGEALTRKLYQKDNPNYSLSVNEEIAFLKKINRDDLVKFHKKLGLGKMIIVATGDVDAKKIEAEISTKLANWQKSSLKIPVIEKVDKITSEKIIVPIKDKTSADIVIGSTIEVGDKHPDFYPMMIATSILGGGFTARLIQEVRDKKGLTYGTYAYTTGTGNNTPGYFVVWGTFAPELLGKGLEALSTETKKFITKGVTAKELINKKETITGNYKVGLSTTKGLATIILSNAEHDRAKEFIDEYPEIIKNISLSQVNEAIKKYLDHKKLITVIAGSV